MGDVTPGPRPSSDGLMIYADFGGNEWVTLADARGLKAQIESQRVEIERLQELGDALADLEAARGTNAIERWNALRDLRSIRESIRIPGVDRG